MEAKNRRIAASLLAADFADMGNAVRVAESAGVDWLHLDIMDGVFVPPISFGAQMVKNLRGLTELPLDAHLMTVNPERHLEAFHQAGVDRLTFHIEIEHHAHRLLTIIRERGMKAGISLVPSTSLTACEELLPHLDQVLVMTVNPGWGGQTLIPGTLDKVRRLNAMRRRMNLDFLILIDGGVNKDIAAAAWEAGVDVLVSGSTFFSAEDPSLELQMLRHGGRSLNKHDVELARRRQ